MEQSQYENDYFVKLSEAMLIWASLFLNMDNVLNCNLKNSDEVILNLPDNIAKHRDDRTVCIDREIVDVIKYLWKNNINTFGCCCGHKMMKPSVIIEKDTDKVKKIISEVDNREWEILKNKP